MDADTYTVSLHTELVLHKRTSAQSIYSRVSLHVSIRC